MRDREVFDKSLSTLSDITDNNGHSLCQVSNIQKMKEVYLRLILVIQNHS